MTRKKWHEVYPYGTKEGDEEAKVFRALSRHAKYDFRSTGALEKATGLSQTRIEEIIDKYVNHFSPPLIIPHPKNEDHWAYWERCTDILKKDKRNLSQRDQDDRVNKHLGTTTCTTCDGGDDCDDCDQ